MTKKSDRAPDKKPDDGLIGDSDNIFDDFLDDLRLPDEGLDGSLNWDPNNAQLLGPIPNDLDIFTVPPLFSHSETQTQPPKSFPKIDKTRPEQKQRISFVEQADGSSIKRHNKSADIQETSLFQTKNPVPFTESSASIPTRTRSQRRRSLLQSPWIISSFTPTKTSNSMKKKEKGNSDKELEDIPANSKKCSHCDTRETPQWREGPLGPMTLCNACGIRYKSGRLFPEYRPASSPTFVPSMHSNYYKKVSMMRNKQNSDEDNVEKFPSPDK